MAVPLLSGVCVLSVCFLLLSPGLYDPGAHGLGDMQDVLGHFLHMLNVTDEGPRSGPTDPPEYMLELYRLFSGGPGSTPSARTVRSFRNEDWTSERVMSESVRSLRLLFNISVPQNESLVSAELRLHMSLSSDPRRHPASGWKLTIFNMRRDGRHRTQRNLLVSKHTHRKDSGWEVFDMTNAVRHWRKVNTVTPRLEVHIENLNAFRNVNDWQYADLDIDRNPDGKHEPALIIFSDSPTEDPRTKEKSELWRSRDEDQQDNRSDSNSEDGLRVRRSAKVEDCQMSEMYVNFKDIGWDSFILAPSGYQAFTCRGACNYPLTSEVTPTKHAIVRSLLNLKNSQKATRACCVPTVLQPLSVLYVDKNGVVVLENYEGMVVKECGCR